MIKIEKYAKTNIGMLSLIFIHDNILMYICTKFTQRKYYYGQEVIFSCDLCKIRTVSKESMKELLCNVSHINLLSTYQSLSSVIIRL